MSDTIMPGVEALFVLIPCYNEAENVATTVADVLRVAATLPLATSVVLIDDGSKDDTSQVMGRICAQRPECQMFVNRHNLGVGRSVLACYPRIPDGAWVTVIPGDNEFDFASIRGLLESRAGADVVLGYLRNPVIRPLHRRFASWAFLKVVSTLYGFGYRYLNGMKLYRIEALRGIEVVSSGHAFNAELFAKAILRRPELRILEAPFIARGRARGTSKAIRPTAILRAIWEVWRGYRSVARYRREVIKQAFDTSQR